jgi:hypothetical protein
MDVLEKLQVSKFGGPLRTLRSRVVTVKWIASGRPMPMPPHMKRILIKRTAEAMRANHFIETGTYRADTSVALAAITKRVTTIEVDVRLAELAQKRCNKLPVEVLVGDSSVRISDAIVNRGERCLFWLDGHYSAGVTGGGDIEVPIYRELDVLLPRLTSNDLILIDDAREFIGGEYPTLGEIRQKVRQLQPNLVMHVHKDMIAIGSINSLRNTEFQFAPEFQ